MQNKLFFLLLITTTLLTQSCKTIQSSNYSKSLALSTPTPIQELNYNTTTKLNPTEKSKQKLQFSDPILIPSGPTQAKNSNYDTFSLSLDNPGTYNIKITSLCDCFGFNKAVFIPALGFENNDFEWQDLGSELLHANFSKPLRMEGNWKLTVDEATKVNFVVYADNSRLDEKLTTVFVPIRAGFKGRYIVEVTRM